MNTKTTFNTLKNATVVIALGIGLAAGTTFASNTTWQGTTWINDGSVISATSLKDNLNYLKEQVTAGGLWTQNGANAYYNSGNVGIGTSAPGAKLDVAGDIRTRSGRSLWFGTGNMRINGDSSSAWYFDSNSSNNTQLILRDKERTQYGRLYGASNGAYFGLLDGDGNWSYLAKKDDYTQFRINNSAKMTIKSNGNVGIGTSAPGNKLEVAGKIEADSYCDRSGRNCTKASNLGTNASNISIKVDYGTCYSAPDRGSRGNTANPWGYMRNTNFACTNNSVLVGMDSGGVSNVVCCKLKIVAN